MKFSGLRIESGGVSYLAAELLGQGVVVVQDLSEKGLQQLLQGGLGQSMASHLIHLHTHPEQQ